ncbi:DNA repair protein [Puniceibacterium confluentis]|uniref:DNA repair protein n=1 Tax=Puniceibacterium confluentis TaxID=1958944 RepID=UPI0011B4559F|nr:DNA repair protein [Puniceibacterium confluentis]
MLQSLRSAFAVVQYLMQWLAMLAIGSATLLLIGYTISCALGLTPWLSLSLQFGDLVLPNAGTAVQLALTALALSLCFFLPTNARVMALETSHRRFHIGMKDVARAYQVAHHADREGLFQLSSEFDSIRERIAFLREHPDLSELEPSVLEVASQMSHLSRELAQVYSDRNVARARDFLVQRQQEIEDFNIRLNHAKGVATEMRQWLTRVEMDEAVAESQLTRLCDELAEILPELGATAPAAEETEIRRPVIVADAEEEVAPPDDRIVALLARRAAE